MMMMIQVKECSQRQDLVVFIDCYVLTAKVDCDRIVLPFSSQKKMGCNKIVRTTC